MMTQQTSFLARLKARHALQFDVRPAVPGDAEAYAQLVDNLPYGLRYFRFGNGNVVVDKDYFTRRCSPEVFQGRCLLCWVRAGSESAPELTGCADYAFLDGVPECEMTIVVAKVWHGSPVAYRLLTGLLEAARADGMERMHARVMATNRRMLDFMQRNGFSSSSPQPGDSAAILHLSRDCGLAAHPAALPAGPTAHSVDSSANCPL